MERLFRFIIAMLAGALLVYGLLAFYEVTFNIASWAKTTRDVFVVVYAIWVYVVLSAFTSL